MHEKKERVKNFMKNYMPYRKAKKKPINKMTRTGITQDGVLQSVVDINELKFLWDYYKRDVHIQRCIGILNKYIFAEGVELHIGGLPISVTKACENHIKNHWIKFGQDLLAWFVCIGAAPVAIRQHVGEPTPVVLKPGTGTFISTLWRSEQQLQWLNNCTAEEDEESVIVFTLEGNNIGVNGDICSIVSTLVPEKFDCNCMSTLTIKSIEKAIDPMLIIERTEKSYETLNKEPKSIYYACNPDKSYPLFEQNQIDRDDIFDRVLEEMVDYYDGDRSDPASTDFVPPLGYNGFYNTYRVPSGFKIIDNKQNYPNINISQAKKDYAEIVYSRFDIPRSLVGLDDSKYTNVRSTFDTEGTFIQCIKYWKVKIGDIMSNMWRSIYDKDGCNFLVGKWNPSLGKYMTENHLVASISSLDNPYQIVFPPSPFTTLDELHVMFDRGILPEEEYIATCRKIKGFSHTKRAMAFLKSDIDESETSSTITDTINNSSEKTTDTNIVDGTTSSTKTE